MLRHAEGPAGAAQDELRSSNRPARLYALWRGLSLARQFVAAACVVSILSVFALGLWITKKIEQSALETAASSIGLYIGHFVSPHLQGLSSRPELSPGAIAALAEIERTAAAQMRVRAIKVWGPNGRLLYSSDRSAIGKTHPVDAAQQKAWDGLVSAEYNQLDAEESRSDHEQGIPLFEVYVPIRADGSDKILVVTEFHQNAEALEDQLTTATWQSWLVTVLVALAMVGALSSIVADGSKTIDNQREELFKRVSELSQLLEENRHLYSLVEASAHQATENNERFLREIGSDIHDGPAQLLALALLELNNEDSKSEGGILQLKGTLSQALKDLRDICAGLVLPETPREDLREALAVIIGHHESRTQTLVHFEAHDLPSTVSARVTNGLCRFVQETLTNAFRHAGGKGQRVLARSDGINISVQVSDEGPGMPAEFEINTSNRLGLVCLMDRIRALGGDVVIEGRPCKGTCVTAVVVANTR